jgi:hypothetical protein
MKVFISYGAAADQVTALRLQALAAVKGLSVYVPPAYTRHGVHPDPEPSQNLDASDLVLGVIGSSLGVLGGGLSEACRQELNAGVAAGKPTIVMADPAVAPQLQPHFGPHLITIDPAHPDRAELAIVEYLKSIDAEQNAKKALIALGTLALGLLIFAPQE